jgi:hypothetical protein
MEPLGFPSDSRETEDPLLHLCIACVRCGFQRRDIELMLSTWGFVPAPAPGPGAFDDDLMLNSSFAFDDDTFQFSALSHSIHADHSDDVRSYVGQGITPALPCRATTFTTSLKRRREDAHIDSDGTETACSPPQQQRTDDAQPDESPATTPTKSSRS